MSGRAAAVARRLRHFYSDNTSCVHPLVMQGILNENSRGAHEHGYGHDPATVRAKNVIRDLFGGKESVNVYPMWSGTGANVLSIGTIAYPPERLVFITVSTFGFVSNDCDAQLVCYLFLLFM